ncbi:TetR/AcrR family transcriptional regulator [Virgisporangium aurantiacum]|uniref:TetR family transcriptional regulator n=1 Tax=Virgisporangium aurantiacum TaxID=175570 RepID=A0A8J3ZEZ8_9ACTN|nr:TetR family transcriptional regulator [Virgisporangium aurantiacum]GIJ62867.1 TetR family transcriptional regulator [Virgisporangium aurantiacum]
MSIGDADRKVLIADAAIDVLGRDGLRSLTHRAVDARAGLPQGTCSYHHRTRRSLLAAALNRIADLDRADTAPAPAGDVLDQAVAVLGRWLGPGRVRTRARLVLMLDAEARRDLGDEAARLAGDFVAEATTTIGDARKARLLVALLDGVVADDLIRGTDDPPSPGDLRARVAAVFTAVSAA